VQGDGPIQTGGDGVVKYESAHIEGVESELVVRWGHSVQGHPKAVGEVRRILLEHLGDLSETRELLQTAPLAVRTSISAAFSSRPGFR
jgi:hypothetical protein